jgi:hypothetical protein
LLDLAVFANDCVLRYENAPVVALAVNQGGRPVAVVLCGRAYNCVVPNVRSGLNRGGAYEYGGWLNASTRVDNYFAMRLVNHQPTSFTQS